MGREEGFLGYEGEAAGVVDLSRYQLYEQLSVMIRDVLALSQYRRRVGYSQRLAVSTSDLSPAYTTRSDGTRMDNLLESLQL